METQRGNDTVPFRELTRTLHSLVLGMPDHLSTLPSVTCLVGPPGSGKTMLLEFLRSSETDHRGHASTCRHVVTLDDADSGEAHRLDELRSLLLRTRTEESLRVVVSAGRLSLRSEVTRLLRGHDAVVLEIPPLSRADVSAIAEETLGGPVTARAVEAFHHLSMGRPALLHQLLAANHSRGGLNFEDGYWRLGTELRLGEAYMYLDGPDPAVLPLEEQRAEHIVAAVEEIDYASLVELTSPGAVDALITRRVLQPRSTQASRHCTLQLDFRQPLRRHVIRRLLTKGHLLHLRGQVAALRHPSLRPGADTPVRRREAVDREALNLVPREVSVAEHTDRFRSSHECASLLLGSGASDIPARTAQVADAGVAPSIARGIEAIGFGAIDGARQSLLPSFRRLTRTPQAPSFLPALWGTAYLAHLTADPAVAFEVRSACGTVPSLPPALRLLVEAWSAPPDSPPDVHLGDLLRARDALDGIGMVALADFLDVDMLATGCPPDSIPSHLRPHLSPLSHLVDQTYRTLRDRDVLALTGICRSLDDGRPTVVASILIAVAWRLALQTGSREVASQLRRRLDARLALTPQLNLPVFRSAEHPIGLSSREDEILALVKQGRTNREIAESLTLSVRTVEGHVFRALRRLGLHSRGELGPSVLARGL